MAVLGLWDLNWRQLDGLARRGELLSLFNILDLAGIGCYFQVNWHVLGLLLLLRELGEVPISSTSIESGLRKLVGICDLYFDWLLFLFSLLFLHLLKGLDLVGFSLILKLPLLLDSLLFLLGSLLLVSLSLFLDFLFLFELFLKEFGSLFLFDLKLLFQLQLLFVLFLQLQLLVGLVLLSLFLSS